MPNKSSAPSIFAGKLKDKLVLRIVGQGKAGSSSAISHHAEKALEEGANEIVIDLKSCDWMDSTFVGTLAGLAIRLQKANAGCVALVNVSESLHRQIEEFGLTQLFSLEKSEQNYFWAVDSIEDEAQTAEQLARAILDAHEQLIKVNPENAERFALLQKTLLGELQNLGDDASVT